MVFSSGQWEVMTGGAIYLFSEPLPREPVYHTEARDGPNVPYDRRSVQSTYISIEPSPPSRVRPGRGGEFFLLSVVSFVYRFIA